MKFQELIQIKKLKLQNSEDDAKRARNEALKHHYKFQLFKNSRLGGDGSDEVKFFHIMKRQGLGELSSDMEDANNISSADENRMLSKMYIRNITEVLSSYMCPSLLEMGSDITCRSTGECESSDVGNFSFIVGLREITIGER